MMPYGGAGGGGAAGSGATLSPRGNASQRFASIAEAAKAQNVEAVMEMLEQGFNVDRQDSENNTALHWAAWFKLDSLLQPLLERKARPDISNCTSETPVHWAAKSQHIAAMDAMTKGDRGLLSLRDCDGFTAFIISAQNDNAPVMEWLYLKGIGVEEQDDWGRTALQWACYKGHRRTVQWLLSRSASIVHRDHEGMTAIHWAALKGREQAAEMLLDVGAVHLLDAPDKNGDTPISLAMRKRNRYMVACFHKCQLCQYLFGRPHISQNNFANLFVCFISLNIVVFAFFLAPGIANSHPEVVVGWSFLMAGSLVLWVQNCSADPGWMQPRTIYPQDHLMGNDPTAAFDAEQPVESQMAHFEGLASDQQDETTSGGPLARMEREQTKFNYQRMLILQARRRLGEEGALAGRSELQPLMGGLGGDAGAQDGSPKTSEGQLERAARALRDRERAAGERISRARVEHLLSQGCGEYLTLLDRGDFKQVCVVCRARRQMRSHHCKECGRCVERLDHHCPWIDNCVGLGNQRSFYCFIVMLLATISGFYYVVVLYAFDTVFPDLARGIFGDLMNTLVVLFSAAFDLIWLAFVGALVVRHTAYMAVNITTYEVLVRPNHVQRRFPKNKGRFWFLQDFGPCSCIINCFNYWTLSTERDAADFLGATPQDSFLAPGADSRSSAGAAASQRDLGRSTAGPGGSPVAYHLLDAGGLSPSCPPDAGGPGPGPPPTGRASSPPRVGRQGSGGSSFRQFPGPGPGP